MKRIICILLILISFAQNLNFENNWISVYKDDTYQFTGVAVSKKGRLFVNYPLWNEKRKKFCSWDN